jgi:hypothetical protein
MKIACTTALDMAQKEWEQARDAFYQAQANFDYADPDYLDIAIKELKLAEDRMGVVLQKVRRLQEDMFKGYTDDDLRKLKNTTPRGSREYYLIKLEIMQRNMGQSVIV